jgi:predicted AAA+ superfamily ATPase
MEGLGGKEPVMTDPDTKALLARIADALDRLAPPPAPAESFETARLYRYAPDADRFDAAPDYGLALELLVGIERQKARFVENLGRFAAGVPANHALLWGARGGGKSSLTKAAFMAMAQDHPNLRLVEVDSDEIGSLPHLFDALRSQALRFVVLCDDLSFEEGPGGMAASAKLLKSALEGGVGGPPQNVLFVATSNRRHLMPRDHGQDRGAIAAAEDAEEEVSVSDRFGLWIGFPPMDQPSYLDAVRSYAARFSLEVADLDRRALQWSQLRGGRSGRVAWQFTRDLAGELGKPLPL